MIDSYKLFFLMTENNVIITSPSDNIDDLFQLTQKNDTQKLIVEVKEILILPSFFTAFDSFSYKD